MLEWNKQQGDKYGGIKGFALDIKEKVEGRLEEYFIQMADMPGEVQEIFTDGLNLLSDKTSTFLRVLRDKDAPFVVEYYEMANDLKTRLDQYSNEAKIDLNDYQGYETLTKYLKDNKDAYDGAKASMDAYVQTTVDNLLPTISGYDEMQKTLGNLKAGAKEDEKVMEEYAQAWDDMISSIKDSDWDNTGKWVRESLLNILGKDFPQIAKYSKQWKEFLSSGGNEMADSVSETTESVNKLAVALSNATKAKNAFDEAMKRDAENKGFSDYQGAYSAYAAEIKAGRVNSQVAMAAAEYLMAGGAVDFETLYREQGYKGVNAYMKKGYFETLYGNTDKAYGEGLLDVLSKLANKNGEIVNSNGEVVATYKKVGKEVSFTIDDLKGLSEVMGGVSIAQIWDSIKALGVYGDVKTEIDSFTDALEAMGEAGGFLSSSESGKLAIDYEKFLNYAKEIGMSSEEWGSMKNWLNMLNELGEIEIQNVPDVEGGWQEYDDMVDGVAEKAEKAAESAQEAKESLEDAAETVQETKPALPEGQGGGGEGGGTENKAQALLDEYNRVLTELDALVASKDYTITFTADGNAAIYTIQTIDNNADVASRERTITFDPQTGGVVQIIDVIKDHADQVAETRTIKYKADGTIDNITITRQNAKDPTVTDQFVYYYTNGEIDHVSLTKAKAGEAVGPQLVAYYANGEIDHLEWVEETASGFERYPFKVAFGADGSIEGLTLVEETADGETKKKTYRFKFGADGKPLETEVEEIKVYANGTTSDPIVYTLSADDPAYDTIQAILAFIEDNYSGQTSEYDLNANNEGAKGTVAETETEITDSTGKDLGEYVLTAANSTAEGIKAATSAIAESIANTNTTYHLKADWDDGKFEVFPYKKFAETAMEDGMENAVFNAIFWFAKQRQSEIKGQNAEITGDGMDLASVLYRALTGKGPTSPNVKTIKIPGVIELDPIDEEEVKEATGGDGVEVPVNPESPETHFIWDLWLNDYKNSDFYKTVFDGQGTPETPPGEFFAWDLWFNEFKKGYLYKTLTGQPQPPPGMPIEEGAEQGLPVYEKKGVKEKVLGELEVSPDDKSAKAAAEEA